jgi:nucleoid-associated protein YgaU
MRKELVIPGVIVAACLGLVVLTLTLPKKSKSVSSDTPQSTDTNTGFGSDTTAPAEGFGTTPTAPVGFGSPTTPTGTTGFGSTTTTPSGFGTPAPAAPSFTTPGTSTAPVGFGKPAPAAPTPTPAISQNPTPAAPVAPAPVTSPGEKTHVVAKGETLGDISMKYYGSSKYWKKIAEANKIDPTSLQVGQKLTLPEIAAPAPAATSGDAAASDERTYKIKAGDTYYTIAKKELGSAARWKEIEKLNKLSPEDLRVGMSIKLPAAPLKKEGAAKDTAPASDNASTGRTHTVAAGETLGDISRKHYGTSKHWKKIVEANPGVDAESLKVGQKLNLPDIAGAPAAGNEQSAAPAAPTGAEYVVKAGDTMEIIAQNQLGKKTEAKRILEANPGVDPRKLRIGQKLIIPGKTASEPAPAATPAPANTMPAPMDNFGTPPPANTSTPAPLQPLPPSTGGFSPPADNPFAQPGLNNGSNPP